VLFCMVTVPVGSMMCLIELHFLHFGKAFSGRMFKLTVEYLHSGFNSLPFV
jgi:hypothetical protein